MEEKLVEFETAKLAKDKGFDIPCIWFYHKYSKDKPVEKGGDKIKINSDWNSNDNKMTTECYSAPTQSLLQKWLRENHNINICLNPIYGGTKIEGKQTGWLCYTPYNDEMFNSIPSVSVSEYTYEEALEKGLKAALKLINNE